MNVSFAAMDSDTAFPTSRPHNVCEKAPEQTVASAIAGFEKSLAALRLGGISKPLTEVAHSNACSCAQVGKNHNCAAAAEGDEIGQQPQSKADTIYVQRDQLHSSELPRLDSTSSMRSFMTDSIFSNCSTTDTCPPSPSLSAPVAEPLHCGSWNLDSGHVLDPSRRNTWPVLRTGGQKGSGYVSCWSPPAMRGADIFAEHQFSLWRHLTARRMARLSLHANTAASKQSQTCLAGRYLIILQNL